MTTRWAFFRRASVRMRCHSCNHPIVAGEPFTQFQHSKDEATAVRAYHEECWKEVRRLNRLLLRDNPIGVDQEEYWDARIEVLSDHELSPSLKHVLSEEWSSWYWKKFYDIGDAEDPC